MIMTTFYSSTIISPEEHHPELMLEQLIKAAKQSGSGVNHQTVMTQLKQCFLADAGSFPLLLTNVIYELKQQEIPVEQARGIASIACHLLGDYIREYPYKKEEEDQFKQVISLLSALIFGAIKTSVTTAPTPSQPIIVVDEKKSQRVDKSSYSYVAFIGIQSLLTQTNLTNDILLDLATLYCIDWPKLLDRGRSAMRDFLKSLNFMPNTDEGMEFCALLQEFGLREVIGLAEYQYRKNQYINVKSRLNEGSQELERSPFELLDEKLAFFLQKVKDSLSAIASLDAPGELDFSADAFTYLNSLQSPTSPQNKLLITFHALTQMYIEGLHRNYKARNKIEETIQFGQKAQNIYRNIAKHWIHQLGEITRLAVTVKVISTLSGDKMKRMILCWPLSSFFPECNDKKLKITQTVIKDKVELLPLDTSANLLILLNCNVQETVNPLGQVHHLYASFREKMALNPQNRQFTEQYLLERGFTPHQINLVLEAPEDAYG